MVVCEMNTILHVENEKGVEVTFSPPLHKVFAVKEPQNSRLISVTISSYSKDGKVLNGSIAKTRMQISCVPQGFCRYLYDRRKAGVIKYDDLTLYVLPPKSPEDTILSCICATSASNDHDEKGSPSSSLLDQSKTKTIAPSSNSSSSSSSSKSTAPPSSKPTITAPKDDIMSILLNKVVLCS
jgi:hypothetical protein